MPASPLCLLVFGSGSCLSWRNESISRKRACSNHCINQFDHTNYIYLYIVYYGRPNLRSRLAVLFSCVKLRRQWTLAEHFCLHAACGWILLNFLAVVAGANWPLEGRVLGGSVGYVALLYGQLMKHIYNII